MNLKLRQIELLDLYHLLIAGGESLIMHTNIKRWERVKHGGRPELYPQYKKGLLTCLELAGKKRDLEEQLQNMQSGGSGGHK